MKLLSREAFERAADFLRHGARPLERALFAHAFEDGGRTPVLAALVPYQNDDGGFGRALEPDMRAEASSVVATTRAACSRVLASTTSGSTKKGSIRFICSVGSARSLVLSVRTRGDNLMVSAVPPRVVRRRA